MTTLGSTLLIVLTLLTTMTRGARKLEILQLANLGQIVSSSEDWINWSVLSTAGTKYSCRPEGDGGFSYGPKWLKFRPGITYPMNAWISVDSVLTFTLQQYNFGISNDGVSLVTSGWSAAAVGYYLLSANMTQFRSGATVTISIWDLSFSVEVPPTNSTGAYMFVLHLKNETVGSSEYAADTITCSPGGSTTKSGSHLQLLLLLLLACLLQAS